jgi:hypothetical protein
MTAGARSRGGDRGWFAGWVVVGAGFSFGLIGIASIGVLVLPVAGLGAAVLARRREPGLGISGLVGGLGVAPLYVAYLNRDGPGTICRVTGTSTACEDQWSPWPWVGAGVVLVAVGIVWFVLARGDRHGSPRP